MTDQTALDDFDAGPEPIEGVYRFRPAGHECAGCGDVVRTVWLADVPDGDRYVCKNCKEW